MKVDINRILGGLFKALKFWKKGHDAGLWDKGHEPNIAPPPAQLERPSRAEKLGRGFAIVLAAGAVSVAASCPPSFPPDWGVNCAVNPLLCPADRCKPNAEGDYRCEPVPTPTPPPPTTLPPPSPEPDCQTIGCPIKGQVCTQITKNPPTWECVQVTPPPTTLPTPPPTPTPPPPTTLPPPPSPPPCQPSLQRVCVDNDGKFLGIFDPKAREGPTACWTTRDWVAYMKRSNWTASAGTLRVVNGVELGVNLGGSAGNRTDECTRTDDGWVVDCADPSRRIRWGVDPPRVVERVVPCPPSPTPTPGPTPSPNIPPSPLPGVACTPLSHVGVAFHAQHPAPNGPLGYRWVFSATPKSRKPFCPDKRNECEQQAYQGDPVNAYDSVVWRFDLRFQCQDPAGPLWNQQEPHTGSSWENTDVRQENAYMANLKPAVKGLHRVRTCRRDAPSVCEITEKVAN